MVEDSIHDRASAVKGLLESFRLERIVYLVVTLVSFVVLLVSALFALIRGSADPAELVGLFGASGAITYSSGRILRMWTDAVRVLQPALGKEE